ncbi:MAG: hypothetical protein ABJF23_29400 [Bryobacteraceae bacterium]
MPRNVFHFRYSAVRPDCQACRRFRFRRALPMKQCHGKRLQEPTAKIIARLQVVCIQSEGRRSFAADPS